MVRNYVSTGFPIGRPPKAGPTCAVCTHPDADVIANDLVLGVPYTHIAKKYGQQAFTPKNIRRHVERCLRTKWAKLKEDRRITVAEDVKRRLQFLLNEAKEAYYAAKDVLLVDGELNMNPREWEISVVYRDWADLTEAGEPKIKTALLSKLLARLAEAGKEAQHSYIKAEDPRKGYRDFMAQMESIIDRFAKLTGAYQQDRKNEDDLFNELCATIKRVATQMGTSYDEEIKNFLRMKGDRLRPDLRDALQKESLSISPPLPLPRAESERVSPITALLPETIAKNSGKKDSGNHDDRK